MRLEDIIEESHDKALSVAVSVLLILSISIVGLGFLYSSGPGPTGQLVGTSSIEPLFNDTNETTGNETNESTNTPPTLTEIPGQNISDAEQFDPINLSRYADDNETDVRELNWTFGGNEHISLTIKDPVLLEAQRESDDWNGTETINITVIDEGGLSASVNLTLSVYKNYPPSFANVSNITTFEGQNISASFEVHDPNGDNITLDYSPPLNESGGWSIPENYTDNITYRSATITATDVFNKTTSRSINITIVDNDPPQMLNLSVETGQQHANFTGRFNEECTFFIVHKRHDELDYNISEGGYINTATGNRNEELIQFLIESYVAWNGTPESFRRNISRSDLVLDDQHRITVHNLSRDTEYNYIPIVGDAYRNYWEADESSYKTQERPIEPPQIDTFNGSTTDFSLLPPGQNLTCVDMPIFEKPGRGKMEILENCVSVADLNIDKHLDISKGEMSLNRTAAPELNRRSRISLYGINKTDPGLLCDGDVCNESRYTFIGYENDSYVFTTENVTSFSVVEKTHFDTVDNADNGTIATEDTFRIDSTLKYYGSPLEDDYCSVRITESSYNISMFDGDHRCLNATTNSSGANSSEEDTNVSGNATDGNNTQEDNASCTPSFPVTSQMDYDDEQYHYSITFADHVNLTDTGNLSYEVRCNLSSKDMGVKESSGKVEVVYDQYCGNGICDNRTGNESCENCSEDCGLCPCVWEYPSWDKVPCIEGEKRRNVTHGPNCRETTPKPNETKPCGVALCDNGEQDPKEEGVDCGGPCEPCETCDDGIQNQGEEGVDCGGPCEEPCPTCNDDIQNQGEEGVDCGGPCEPCATCHDNIQNQGEEGVDCGGPCEPCEDEKEPQKQEPSQQDNLLIIGIFSLIVIIMLGGMGAFIYLKKDVLFGPQQRATSPPASSPGPSQGQSSGAVPATTYAQTPQRPAPQKADPGLVSYIKKYRLKNVPERTLRQVLGQKGWSKQQLDIAIKQAREEILDRYAAQIAPALTRYDLSNPHVVKRLMQSSRYPKNVMQKAIERVLKKRYPPHVLKRIQPYLQ